MITPVTTFPVAEGPCVVLLAEAFVDSAGVRACRQAPQNAITLPRTPANSRDTFIDKITMPRSHHPYNLRKSHRNRTCPRTLRLLVARRTLQSRPAAPCRDPPHLGKAAGRQHAAPGST